MRQHIPLRLMAALILQSSTVPLSLSVLARPEPAGPQAAFNRLQARSNSALAVNWDTRSEVPDFLSALDPAAQSSPRGFQTARLENQSDGHFAWSL